MCRKHEPKPLYTKPDPATQRDLLLAYILRGHGDWITCSKCGLTGCMTSFGNVRWFTKGTVGHYDREKRLAKAAAWNALVDVKGGAA